MSFAKHLRKTEYPSTIFQKPTPVMQPNSVNTRQVLAMIEQQAMQQLSLEQPPLASMTEKIYLDPGTDISTDDNELWLWLFAKAREISYDLHARLFYIRGGGSRLVPHEKYGYIIQPIIDAEGKRGWESREFYDQEKKCLNLFKNEIQGLLAELRRSNPPLSPAS